MGRKGTVHVDTPDGRLVVFQDATWSLDDQGRGVLFVSGTKSTGVFAPGHWSYVTLKIEDPK